MTQYESWLNEENIFYNSFFSVQYVAGPLIPPAVVSDDNPATFLTGESFSCGFLDFKTGEVSFGFCNGPESVHTYVCAASLSNEDLAALDKAKEEDTVYVGSQLEYCLLTIQVCLRNKNFNST